MKYQRHGVVFLMVLALVGPAQASGSYEGTFSGEYSAENDREHTGGARPEAPERATLDGGASSHAPALENTGPYAAPFPGTAQPRHGPNHGRADAARRHRLNPQELMMQEMRRRQNHQDAMCRDMMQEMHRRQGEQEVVNREMMRHQKEMFADFLDQQEQGLIQV